MSKLRRKFITVLAVLFCALLTISTALMIPKTKTAEAYGSTITETVDELTLNDNGNITFKAENLQDLYDQLSSGAETLDDVKSNLLPNSVNEVALANRTEEIQVKFGGKVWTAVYLSKATTANATVGGAAPQGTAGAADNGDVVLTLWLANPTQYSYFNKYGANNNGSYPANMYGSSYMRSVVLGNGGQYATGIESLTNPTAADANITAQCGFSDFATGDYAGFLVSPRYIGWQYQESAASSMNYVSYSANGQSTNKGQDLLNDAWGILATSSSHANFKANTVTSNGVATNVDIYYEDKGLYGAWKDDLVWLPSMAEVGWSTSDNMGLWQTKYTQRQYPASTDIYSLSAWLRSAWYEAYNANFILHIDERNCVRGWDVGNDANKSFKALVRPAIHLNLTVADGSRGIDFGPTGTTVTTENTTGTDVKVATKNGNCVYNDSNYTINVPDYDGLTATGDTSFYDSLTGEFSVKEPDTNSEKTYEITVTPKENYVWKDTSDPDKKGASRKYRIKIKLAEITAAWPAKTIASGQSLLPDSNPTVFGGASVESSIDQRFYKVEPNGTDTPPADWLTNGGWNVQWEPRNASSNYFKANQTGTYTVYYEIDANFHNTKRGSYTVTVSTDSVHISTNSGITISNEIFGDNNAAALKTNLIDNFDSWITMTGSSGTYSVTALQALLSKLEVVLLDDSGMEVVPDAGHDYYNVGTYSLGLQYIPTLPSSDKTLMFVWDTDKPQITIVKRPITVNIVVKNAGDSFTHVYGDSPVGMKCEPDNPNDIPTGENFSDLLIRDNVFVLKGTTTELNNRTAANTYDIEGVARESNYDVSFESVQYTVTPRPITLQVADEEVEYGTDFTNFTFKAMTRTGGSLASGDTVFALTANATYKLWQNGDVAFSATLAIGNYELRAEIPTSNYEFTIVKGNLNIIKANFNMNGVKLENKDYIYDGNPHAAQLNGALPSSEISVSYRYVNYETGDELDGAPTEVGLYIVYASFSHSSPNHNDITDKVAYLRIVGSADDLGQSFPPLPTDAELAAAADLAKKKAEAKKTLDEEAKAKKDEIDADANLSAEEKKAAKEEIDKELKEGNAAIDKAKDKDGVDKAYGDGKKEIEDTTELVQKKGAAKSELDKAAQAKKEAIDNNPDLTDEEKAAAKAEVDKELAKGKAEIDGASSVGDVQSTESTTKTNIENIKAEHKGSFPWWILAVIAGAILLLTVLIIIIVKRRNSDDDDGGYDDYYDDEYDYEEESDDGDEEAYGF